MFWMIFSLTILGILALAYAYQIGWASGFESGEKIWRTSGEEQVAIYRNAMLEMTAKINGGSKESTHGEA